MHVSCLAATPRCASVVDKPCRRLSCSSGSELFLMHSFSHSLIPALSLVCLLRATQEGCAKKRCLLRFALLAKGNTLALGTTHSSAARVGRRMYIERGCHWLRRNSNSVQVLYDPFRIPLVCPLDDRCVSIVAWCFSLRVQVGALYIGIAG